ncbi:hypothetical protein COU61_02270, partial [Candidatus Pacearchaeota archaeon CG10_big_fil_rev_8_21_14_0_10_35_13]
MPYDIIIGRDDADKKSFGKKGLIFVGKGFVKMGNYTSLSNPLWLDVARSHVILVAGKRGSGKSYSLSSIAEQITDLPHEEAKNIAPIIFDTMGIFWTMKYKNDKDKELLADWGLKPKSLPVRVLVPSGHYRDYLNKGIPVDEGFSINISDLSVDDWILTFNLEMTSEPAVLIQKVIGSLKINDSKGFVIDDIIDLAINDKYSSQPVKNVVIGLFEAAKTWGIFSTKSNTGTVISSLAKSEVTTVIDLSPYNSVGSFNIRALVIGLITRKLFNERVSARKSEEIQSIGRGEDYLAFSIKRDMPLVWLFIDEIHEFIPETHKTPATDALIQLLREGRQPGISIVMATQQPGALHRDAITQSDIVISHRVTSEIDLKALNNMMQSYLLSGINKYMDELPHLKGSAIILDDNSERIYP